LGVANSMSEKPKVLMCARCVKPIVGEQTTVGRYTYGPCCIEGVKK
jgi:hypothetical protein